MDYKSLMKDAFLQIKELKAELEASKNQKTEPIAIIGMGCRFPGGVNTPAQFWQLLRDGVDAIGKVPQDRWDLSAYYDPEPDTLGKMHTPEGGFLERIDTFDADFFGISPREAISLDPQQRLLLEVSWEALESAALIPLFDSATGIFIGIGSSEYEHLLPNARFDNQTDLYSTTGNSASVAAGRLSYTLGVTGPSLIVDTACSSSLVAIHQACHSLRNQECDLALAGGVGLLLRPETTIAFSKAGMVSPDGRCKTFDADANGYVRSEGCGIVVLRRLSDAMKDGDNILAVIRGSMINQDGRSSGLTAPRGLSQQHVIAQALKNSHVEPSQISYIEAHGTGTSLGDPIEIDALGAVFGKRSEPLWVGAVKTNMGHLEAAAGIAGLIKIVLMLQHGQIPPHLHFKTPNPHIDWQSLPFIKIPTECQPWSAGASHGEASDHPHSSRIAGVSAFGFSGTNAHVVLAEAPPIESATNEIERPWHILTLSAKNEQALADLVQRYHAFLSLALTKEGTENAPLTDICYTANIGRRHFAHRLAVSATSRREMCHRLAATSSGLVSKGYAPSYQSTPKVAFLFTGQGSQYVQMGRELYETQPTFRECLEQCAKILQPFLSKPLLAVLFPNHESNEIDQTACTQPALFALEYALAQLWRSWGVKPDVVMGHSVGEYVAACVAGVFSLEDGLKLIAARGRLMGALPHASRGAMVSFLADETRIRQAIAPYQNDVSIAAINGPQSVVVSGKRTSVMSIVDQLATEGIKSRQLTVSHAFHSPLMAPMLDEFRQVAASISYHKPKLPLVSNVTGKLAGSEISTPDYWVRHVLQAVRFADGVRTLHEQGVNIFLEIGPKATLLGMARLVSEGESGGSAACYLPSLRESQASKSARGNDWQQMLTTLGELYVRGVNVDWEGFDKDYQRRKAVLPTYPFQRERYWIEPVGESLSRVRPLLDKMVKSLLHKATIFETEFSTRNFPFLNDHRIYDAVVSPAACHLAMVLSASEVMFGTPTCVLEDVIFPQALVLPEEGTRTVQVVFTSAAYASADFQLISFDDREQHLTHATGRVIAQQIETPQIISLADLRQNCPTEIPCDSLYQAAAKQQVIFGPTFRWLSRVWVGDGQAVTELECPQTVVSDVQGYWPGLLDACLQTAGANEQESGQTTLPFTIGRVLVYQQAKGRARWCVNQQKRENKSDIYLLDDNGELLAELLGFEVRAAPREAFQTTPAWQELLYTVSWKAKGLPDLVREQKAENYLIVAAREDLGSALANQLHTSGNKCTLVILGEEYRSPQPFGTLHVRISSSKVASPIGPLQKAIINPTHSKHAQWLFNDLQTLNRSPLTGIIYLAAEDSHLDVPQRVIQLNAGLLHLVQALTEGEFAARLWVITQNAQAMSEQDAVNCVQTSLWGLARTITSEYPQLNCTSIDWAEGAELSLLLAQLRTPDGENQIALRGTERYVARLSRWHQPNEQPWRLRLSEYGSIDNLQQVALSRRSPAAHEVEIEVMAVGLNFRDVLNVLGMLKEHYAKELNIHHAEELLLGFECAGIVVAIGDEVSHYCIGDPVIALAEGGFASHVTVNAREVARLPSGLSFEEAATIPVAFLTAYYALNRLAKLQAGERVLIHAASGGVGQAAVQLAQAAGADVFGTASLKKWEHLKSMGVSHLMNSRTLEFADEIMTITAGQGVDVVLNSLNGKFIDKSLASLGHNGRFVEIGKLGIWSAAQMQRERPDVVYYPFELGDNYESTPTLISTMLTELGALFADRTLKPLPLTVFPLEKVHEAFRFMQQTKHIGKIVVSIKKPSVRVEKEGSYLITGGLGGLGLQVAKQLVAEGAGQLVLASRRGIRSESTQDLILELEEAGTQVNVVQADVSVESDVASLLASCPKPLRGIIHAAGVLDDGILSQQNVERFEKVMGPKVKGAWHLHRNTCETPLDFFVCFSSIASLLGGGGQGNYAAANAFLDGLMSYRHAMGLPSLSINWGAWSDVGMAAEMARRERERIGSQGLGFIEPEQGNQVFAHLLSKRVPLVAVTPINWKLFLSSMLKDKPGNVSGNASFFEAFTLVSKDFDAAVVEPVSFRQKLMQVSELSERTTILTNMLRGMVSTIGGFANSQLDNQQSLLSMGLDSLMAIEFRNQIIQRFEVTAPISIFLAGGSIASLATYIIEHLSETSRPQPAATVNLMAQTQIGGDHNHGSVAAPEHLSDQVQEPYQEMEGEL